MRSPLPPDFYYVMGYLNKYCQYSIGTQIQSGQILLFSNYNLTNF